ncbi:hypothetical protein [Sphingomonas gilva]|nr:hypothetical protein [Sphingomonas gilva]
MALFRREAMAERGQALEGAVSLAVPLSWQLVGGLLFLAVAGAMLFLLLAQTDRVLALETLAGDDGRAVAILPEADAASLRPGACGVLALAGGEVAVPACAGGRIGPAPYVLTSGNVVTGHAVTLRLDRPVPASARGVARFAVGRESLWASLAR